MIFLLHHLPSEDRKKQILKDLECSNIIYDIIWVEDFLPENIVGKYQHLITVNELSLSLKHKWAIEYQIQNNIDFSIIFEDDIDLKSIKNIDVFIKKCIEEMIISKYSILWIGGTNELRVPNEYLVDNKITYHNKNFLSRCTHGYILNKSDAIKILKKYHFNLPVDHLFNEIIKNDDSIKSAWSEPFLRQKTVEGLLKSTIR